MADVAPLTPLRYDLSRLGGSLERVVAPPYDVIGVDERANLAARDPHNVVRLILPEGEGDTKYENAARIFDSWRNDGTLVRDDEPAFYRYDQTFAPPGGVGDRITRRGFLGLVKLVPFSAKVVLPHERTLSGPKEDRLKLFRATKAGLSPGFMLYRDGQGELDAPLAAAMPLTKLRTTDGVEHALLKITSKDAIRAIVQGLAKSTLLIADGHHRYETAVRYSEEVASSRTLADRAEPRWFMTFLANGDDPSLLVFPTHRHVHSVAKVEADAFLARAGETFHVVRLEKGAGAAVVAKSLSDAGKSAPSVAACFPDGTTAVLSLKSDVDTASHPVLGAQPVELRRTDVAVLHGAILEHLLGITPAAQAAKTNLWYPQDSAAALGEVRSGRGEVLFLMNATPVKDVRAVAEAGHVMPQKSTFFHPKILTGLAIHAFDPERLVASP